MAAKLLLAALTLTAFAFSGCSGGVDATVEMHDMMFEPSALTVEKGDKVEFHNHDDVSHSATATGSLAFDTGTLGEDDSKTITFNTIGTVTYHCSIHPSMVATIVVE